MTKRIEAISSYISNDDKIIDVGCDHALLGKLLAKRKIHSIASDLRKNIIEKVKTNTEKELLSYIDYRVGDGITLKENETNFIPVLSGMGSYLIIKIIKESNKTFNKIITISNNNHEYLRKEMSKLGYKILLEEIIKEKNKYYNLIIFERGKKDYNNEELFIGFNHQNKETLKEKNEELIKKYIKIINSIEDENRKKELVSKLETLSNYIY